MILIRFAKTKMSTKDIHPNNATNHYFRRRYGFYLLNVEKRRRHFFPLYSSRLESSIPSSYLLDLIVICLFKYWLWGLHARVHFTSCIIITRIYKTSLVRRACLTTKDLRQHVKQKITILNSDSISLLFLPPFRSIFVLFDDAWKSLSLQLVNRLGSRDPIGN